MTPIDELDLKAEISSLTEAERATKKWLMLS
jgi:hypothetical protein